MLKTDLHIHSVHSGHAYGTFYDIINEAKRKGMRMIALTDHGSSMPGAASKVHFKSGFRKPETCSLKVLWGCEANIIDREGTLDLDSDILRKLDIVIAGLHIGTSFRDEGREGNTTAIINCLKRYPIHILAHPYTKYYDYDISRVCRAACDNGALIELNLSSLARLDEGSKRTSIEDVKTAVRTARDNGKRVIVCSDAHFLHEIGDDSLLEKYRDELGIDDDMIINNFPEELDEFMRERSEKWKELQEA